MRIEFTGKTKFAILGFIALAFFGFHLSAFVQSHMASDWQTVSGKITKSDVKNKRSRGHRRMTSYKQAQIEYSYSVQGQQYTNCRVRFTDPPQHLMITQWNTKAIVDKYSAGKHVEIHYDPASPANSVLETELPTSSLVWMAVATVVMAFSGLFFFANSSSGIIESSDHEPTE